MSQTVTVPKPVTREEFFKLFEPSVHAQIAACLDRPTTLGIVCFENLQMDSSHFGHRSAVIYGPGCTSETLEILTGHRLGEVPSVFKYPTAFFVKPL